MLSSKFKTRADLKKTAGHTDLWQEIYQENVERIIPESLFLFHCLHFEGIDILEGLWENQFETVMPRWLSRHNIYSVSNHKKFVTRHSKNLFN